MNSPVSIVIPFYNDDKNFTEFFDRNYAIIKKNNSQNEVIAIDDGKNTLLIEAVEATYKDVILIRHPINKGFSLSINAGVEQAKHDIVYLLNSDILLTPEALTFTTIHFENKQLFAVTLKSQYPDGRIREGAKSLIWAGGMPKMRHAERHFPKPNKEGIIPSAYAVGGHCAIRKSMFLQLNGMDHDTYHPFYWEDSDLSTRAIQNGWEIIYEPMAAVFHPPENSSIKSNFQKEYINSIKFRNRTFFALKNFNSPIRKFQVRVYLSVNFLQKILKLKNMKDAYAQSLGHIKSFKKIRENK